MIHKRRASACGAYIVVPAIVIVGGFASAQQEAPEVELPPMTVSAHNSGGIPYDTTGVSVEVLDVPQLQQQGIYSMAEALTTVPGVSIEPGGGANQRGNVAQVTIRGMSSDTCTLPMIDGMRIFNTGGSGLIGANTIGRTELFSVGTAEVLKGSQGAVYGGGAMGGVVYMETPRGEGEPGMRVFNEVGSHDSYTGNATMQGEEKDLAWFLSTTYTRTDNDIQIANGARPTSRNGGEYESWQEALRMDWQVNEDNALTLTYHREDSEYGYTGFYRDYLNRLTESYSCYSFRTNLVSAKWQSRVTEKFSTSFMAGYYGYDATLGSGYCQNLRNVQLEWRNNYKWCPHHSTTGGFAWNRSTFSASSQGQQVGTEHNLEHTYAFFAEHTYTPTEAWSSSLAARWELSNLYDAQATLRAATSFSFNEGSSRLFASAATGYRAPGAFQRSNGSVESWGTTYHGNPNLDTEQSISADFGYEQSIANDHSFSATFFWQRREDAISTVYTDAANATYENAVGHWTILGTEMALNGTLEHAWQTGYKLAWTYTQPKTEDGKQIPWSTRQTWSADLHTSPIEGLTTGVGLTAAVGRSNYEGYQPGRVDNYYSLRCYARYKLNPHCELHLRVENITDQRFVTESNFSPDCAALSPGTAVYAGCTVQF